VAPARRALDRRAAAPARAVAPAADGDRLARRPGALCAAPVPIVDRVCRDVVVAFAVR
jgi:hypothetical protein